MIVSELQAALDRARRRQDADRAHWRGLLADSVQSLRLTLDSDFNLRLLILAAEDVADCARGLLQVDEEDYL